MDTIAAVATPVGRSAIGIIKISGSKALEIAQRLYKGPGNKKLVFVPSHTLHYGFIFDPGNGHKIDEVLLTVMRAPNTYTREDVVEINCHGGRVALTKTMELILQSGARLAEPGEFTRRAFLNGRIDLTQAEAIIDLINVQSEAGLQMLVKNVEGDTFKPLYSIQEQVREWETLIEAELNFSEDIPGNFSPTELLLSIDQWLETVYSYIGGYETGKLLIEGMKLVITGKTNVGKSSLMNQILHKERSIITSIPGTTTDIIEDFFYLNGILIRIIDTAGFGQSKNEIEKEGIRRSQENILQADLVMLVLDGSQPLDESDCFVLKLLEEQKKRLLIVFNKLDLGLYLKVDFLKRFFSRLPPVVSVSALTGQGLGDITRLISDCYLADQSENMGVAINLRQKNILVEIQKSLMAAKDLIRTEQPEDQLAEEFRTMSRLFKQFRGDQFSEEILDHIFDKFCIGK